MAPASRALPGNALWGALPSLGLYHPHDRCNGRPLSYKRLRRPRQPLLLHRRRRLRIRHRRRDAEAPVQQPRTVAKEVFLQPFLQYPQCLHLRDRQRLPNRRVLGASERADDGCRAVVHHANRRVEHTYFWGGLVCRLQTIRLKKGAEGWGRVPSAEGAPFCQRSSSLWAPCPGS